MERKNEAERKVFPAGAGVILMGLLTPEEAERFPRRCGGDPYTPLGIMQSETFSPQVRG